MNTTSTTQADVATPVPDVRLSTNDPAAVGFVNAITALDASMVAADPFLDPPAKGEGPVVSQSDTVVLGAMNTVVTLLAKFPQLGASVDLTQFAADTDRLRAGIALENVLELLLNRVRGNNLVLRHQGWKDVRAVYNIASLLAPESLAIDQAIEPLVALFARPKRLASAVVGAGVEALKAVNALARSNDATARAKTAQDRAKSLAPDLEVAMEVPAPGATVVKPGSSGGSGTSK